MFSTTFLGHQGWMFRAGQSTVLVDPLLREELGQMHALDYQVYPPRRLLFELFPTIDAVVLTHEHDDHFDIPSLALLDRRIPIYLSSRSSSAAFRILSEMGFAVSPLVPGASVELGELELYPLVGDHVGHPCGDEWDALPFVMRDRGGDGSFFSNVDVTMTRELLARARAFSPKPGLIGWTNNTLDRSHMTSFVPEAGDESVAFAQRMREGQELVRQVWGPAQALLLCGGGFSFVGPRSWLNQHLFSVDPQRVEQCLRAEGPGPRYLAPLPGQTFAMTRGQLEPEPRHCPFLATAPQPSWPSRSKVSSSSVPDYEPATRRQGMSSAEVHRLGPALQELADTLAGGRLFRGLYSLLGAELAGLKCTFGLVLRHQARAAVFEYNPNACCFNLSQAERPRETFLAGMECWATDLLAVLSGELSPIALSFGRARLWNHAPDRFEFEPFAELYRLSHPLRRPQAYLAAYQRILASCEASKPVVHGPLAAPFEAKAPPFNAASQLNQAIG